MPLWRASSLILQNDTKLNTLICNENLQLKIPYGDIKTKDHYLPPQTVWNRLMEVVVNNENVTSTVIILLYPLLHFHLQNLSENFCLSHNDLEQKSVKLLLEVVNLCLNVNFGTGSRKSLQYLYFLLFGNYTLFLHSWKKIKR